MISSECANNSLTSVTIYETRSGEIKRETIPVAKQS